LSDGRVAVVWRVILTSWNRQTRAAWLHGAFPIVMIYPCIFFVFHSTVELAPQLQLSMANKGKKMDAKV
jgi:hypothetical protein